MSVDKLVRTKQEIVELAKECIEHQQAQSVQFNHLTYEEGVRNTIAWLFFENQNYPLDNNRSPATPKPKVEDGRDYLDGWEY